MLRRETSLSQKAVDDCAMLPYLYACQACNIGGPIRAFAVLLSSGPRRRSSRPLSPTWTPTGNPTSHGCPSRCRSVCGSWGSACSAPQTRNPIAFNPDQPA